MSVKEGRQFYDLCRKYKYYWKKYNALKELKEQYYDKDIQRAFYKTGKDLDHVVHQMVVCLTPDLVFEFESCTGIHDMEPRVVPKLIGGGIFG